MILQILKIIVCVLITSNCFAAATLSTGTASGSEGDTMSIGGSSFGTKSVAVPLVFENFDTNDTGRQNTDTLRAEDCSHYGTWVDDSNDTEPFYTNLNQRTGSGLSSSHPLICNDTLANHAPGWLIFAASHQPTVLISYWARMDWAGITGTGNIKMQRMFDGVNDADIYTSLQQGQTNGQAMTNRFFSIFLDEGNTGTWPSTGDGTLNFTETQATWYQYTIMLKASDNDTANGSAIIYQNNSVLESTAVMETWDVSDIWKELTFGWYCANYTAGNVDIKYDDIYVDNSWQSIWIGNNSVWANCTVKEIQIIKTWSDTVATYELNQGGLSDGTAFVYLINSDGDPSNGYQITLGESTGDASSEVGGGSSVSVIGPGSTVINWH